MWTTIHCTDWNDFEAEALKLPSDQSCYGGCTRNGEYLLHFGKSRVILAIKVSDWRDAWYRAWAVGDLHRDFSLSDEERKKSCEDRILRHRIQHPIKDFDASRYYNENGSARRQCEIPELSVPLSPLSSMASDYLKGSHG